MADMSEVARPSDSEPAAGVTVAVARVATLQASRYLQQLCKHWAHKLEVSFTPEEGTVRFPEAVAVMTAEPEVLVVEITAGDAAVLERMKGVVASHLDRFAFKEAPLGFVWSRGGSSAPQR